MSLSSKQKNKHVFVPTARQIEILRRIRSFRYLSSRDHILPLFEDQASRSSLQRDLHLLKENDYIYTLNRRPHEPAIYGADYKGLLLLGRLDSLVLPKKLSRYGRKQKDDIHKHHTLGIATTMLAIERSAKKRDDIRYISQEELLAGAPPKTREEARKHGGKPLRLELFAQYRNKRVKLVVELDWFFGLRLLRRPEGKQVKAFFHEKDRGTESVVTLDHSKASIAKKQFVIYQAWKKDKARRANLYAKLFGLPDIRTLFEVETGYSGKTRVGNFIEANRIVTGGRGSRLFLFIDTNTLLSADDIFAVPLINGKGESVTLLD